MATVTEKTGEECRNNGFSKTCCRKMYSGFILLLGVLISRAVLKMHQLFNKVIDTFHTNYILYQILIFQLQIFSDLFLVIHFLESGNVLTAPWQGVSTNISDETRYTVFK